MFKLTHVWAIAAICLSSVQTIDAQHYDSFKIHSHNDYEQKSPFWNAYANGLTSIEVDVFLKDKTLYATHAESEIIPNNTIRSLYLDPLSREVKAGKITDDIQLLIDLKSEAESTLKEIVNVLKKYPELTSSPIFVLSYPETALPRKTTIITPSILCSTGRTQTIGRAPTGTR